MNETITSVSGLIQTPLFKDVLNAATVLVLAFTAWAGFRASRAAGDANELKLLPLLAIYFEGHRLDETRFLIKNLGEGVAFNIDIEPWQLVLTDIQNIWKLEMWLEGTNVIGKDGQKEVMVKAFSNGKEAEIKDFMLHNLRPDSSAPLPRVPITIRFTNALGKRYFTEVETGPGGVRIRTAPKRLTLLRKLQLFLKLDLKTNILLLVWKFLWLFRKPGFKLGSSQK